MGRLCSLGHVHFTWVILRRAQSKRFDCMEIGAHRLSWCVVIMKILAKTWLLFNIDPPEHKACNSLCARGSRKCCCHLPEFTHKVDHIVSWRIYHWGHFWRVRARFDDSYPRGHSLCLVYSLHVSGCVCLLSFAGIYEWIGVSKKSKKLHFMMQLLLLFAKRKARPCTWGLQI